MSTKQGSDSEQFNISTIGSGSHATRSWAQVLRLLEYLQRLTLRKRNVAPQASHDFAHVIAGKQQRDLKQQASDQIMQDYKKTMQDLW